jgi:PKD repeat protein
VIYKAPARTDFTSNGSVLIAARPVGTDANAAVYRTVRIELRSAEGRLFPPNPDNVAPNCAIVVQAPFGMKTNTSILFQTNSSDPDGSIVRYFWDFGDGSPTSDKPDVEHHYSSAGNYTVTHIVTDNNGLQTDCSVDFEIEDFGTVAI